MVDHDDAFNIVERWRVRRRQVLYACNDAPCRYDDLPHSYSEHVGGDDDRHDGPCCFANRDSFSSGVQGDSN